MSYLSVDGAMVAVASLAGADVDPAWALKLRARPRAHVDLGSQNYDVLVREVSRTERDTMFPKTTAMGPIYAEYQSRAARVIPLFELRRVDSWTLDLRAAANAVESTTSP